MNTHAINSAADDVYNRTVSSIQENIGEFVQGHFDNDPTAILKSLIQLACAAHQAAVSINEHVDVRLPFQTK